MGLGYSAIPAGTILSPLAQCEMIVTFMERLGITDADFVANDSATGIAQLIAANHPGRVRSLLLTNGDVDTNSPPELLMPFIEKCRNGEADAWFARHYTGWTVEDLIHEGILEFVTCSGKSQLFHQSFPGIRSIFSLRRRCGGHSWSD
jgi:pimeloyl-ACP methyl ester carboxylesterase